MASPLPKRIAVTVTTIAAAAACVVGAAVVVAPAGCAGNCATNCPSGMVYIGDLDNVDLSIDDIVVSGPACPPQYGVYCTGDGQTTSCTHVTITGYAQGKCDVAVVFHDRPTEVVHTEFGPPIMQGCCKGYSIIGDSVFVIPDNPDAGISGVDGATDQVTIVIDGGTDGQADGGAVDAGDDGGADAGTGN